MTLCSELFFVFAIAFKRLFIFFSLNPSRFSKSSYLSEYKSRMSYIFFSLTNISTILFPNPSMFIQFLLAK